MAGLVLPVMSVAMQPITTVTKQTRDAMKVVLGRDFIRSLRTSGLPERSVIWRHALRNAALPVVTVLRLVMVGAISGTVFVERVFVLPGLGSLAVTAALTNDITVLRGALSSFVGVAQALAVIVQTGISFLGLGFQPPTPT